MSRLHCRNRAFTGAASPDGAGNPADLRRGNAAAVRRHSVWRRSRDLVSCRARPASIAGVLPSFGGCTQLLNRTRGAMRRRHGTKNLMARAVGNFCQCAEYFRVSINRSGTPWPFLDRSKLCWVKSRSASRSVIHFPTNAQTLPTSPRLCLRLPPRETQVCHRAV
jgi:hypothetical protein